MSPPTPRSGLCTSASPTNEVTSMPMLELNEIRAGYGRLPVLFDINLTVDAGEWVNVVGANGAGRSTLLKTILGETNITAGDVFFEGERITHLSTLRRLSSG